VHAGSTVSVFEPALPLKLVSPANVAAMPPGYVPGATPERLTPLRVATPDAFVVALPTLVPLSLKLIVFPLTAVLSDVLFSVADRVTVAPVVPVAGAAVRVVAGSVLIVSVVLPLLVLCFASPA
jgi:hypothetical protein